MAFEAQAFCYSASDDTATDDNDPRHIKKIATLSLAPWQDTSGGSDVSNWELFLLTYEHSFDIVVDASTTPASSL